MKIKLIGGIICLCLSMNLQAQDELDAIRYGMTQQYGTARGLATGGATGSLGADLGGVGVNPAGIGLFRSSEFSLTPNVSFENTNADFKNNSTTEGDAKFNLNHFGLVLANAKTGKAYQRAKWKTFNFAFGQNRLANYNADYNYTGTDNQSSIIETFAQEVNGLGGFSQIENASDGARAAYNTYVLDEDLNDPNLVRSYVPFAGGLQRTKQVSQVGAMNEFYISMGGNYMEKLMVGATIGLPRIDYTQTTTLSEVDRSGDEFNDFESFDLTQFLSTQGTGVNLKLGAIYRVSNNFRFGLAFHTPTSFNLRDVSSVYMISNTDTLLGSNPIEDFDLRNDPLTFEYKYRSPMRAILSGTYLFNKKGNISADIEYVDYDGMQFDYQGNFANAEILVNQLIENTYKSAVNIRVGGEVIVKNIALRAGFASVGNPYENNSNGGLMRYSLGAGYRNKAFFADFGLALSQMKTTDFTHQLERTVDIPSAEVTHTMINPALTLGWRF